MNIKGIINKVSAEHPYKIPGDRASYSQYNEAWQDCIARKGVITMTEREKTKKAIYSLGFIKGILYNGIYADRLDCIDYAISALKETQQYREIGTVEECRKAVEKQKKKTPVYEGDGYADGYMVYDTWVCTNCGTKYEVDYDDFDFCPKCGQAINWEESEG